MDARRATYRTHKTSTDCKEISHILFIYISCIAILPTYDYIKHKNKSTQTQKTRKASLSRPVAPNRIKYSAG